VAGARRPA